MQDFKDFTLILQAQSGFTLALEMSSTRDAKRMISSRQDGRQSWVQQEDFVRLRSNFLSSLANN